MDDVRSDLCRIFCENCSSGGHFIMQLIFAIVLFVTLVIYVQKLKFTYDIDRLPWNREVYDSATHIGFRLHAGHDTVADCDVVSTLCYNDADCDRCSTKGYKCLNQECRRPFVPNKPHNNCDARKGGVEANLINGEPTCICTAPSFYVGPECDEKNPMLQDMKISADFDAHKHKPDVRFLECDNERFRPFRVGNSFHCLPQMIGDRLVI